MYHDTEANTLHIQVGRTGSMNITAFLRYHRANTYVSLSGAAYPFPVSVEDIAGTDLDGSWKFAFIRNPFAKEWSAYNYNLNIAKRYNIGQYAGESESYTFREYLTYRFTEQKDSSNSALAQLMWGTARGSQVGQIYYANGSIGVDQVCYYEDFNNEWNTKVASVKGFPTNVTPQLRKSNTSIDYRDAYDDWSRELIEQVYADDLATFGYTFDMGPNTKPTATIPTQIDPAIVNNSITTFEFNWGSGNTVFETSNVLLDIISSDPAAFIK